MEIAKKISELLLTSEKYQAENADGQKALNKTLVSAHAREYDANLLALLQSDEDVKNHFFVKVNETTIFKLENFLTFINNRSFLPDSFTAFKNKIGLATDKDSYLTNSRDVVLNWAYKDCILEGGQSKDDQKRNEVFFNEILAPDQITRLLDDKVFTNFKRYDKGGKHEVTELKKTDSLIIKGNNLVVLHSLKKRFAGKVKLIYIDPPYNPDSKSNTFCYNNSFNESTWLTFMKNRLEAAKTLLTDDGAVIVAIDENEQCALGLLLKEIFNKHEIHCITIVHNPRGVQGTNFSYTNEFAFFVIPKGKKTVIDRKIDEKDIEWSNLRNWGTESERTDAKNCFYPIIANTKTSEIINFGNVCEDDYHPNKNEFDGDNVTIFPIDNDGVERKWRYARQSVDDIKNLLRVKKKNGYWDIEIGKDFGQYKTVWINERYDANEYGTKIVKSLVPETTFDFPKSLWNVYDCLYSVVGKDKNAIVLDFFGGSGTTAHAVLELNKDDDGNRQFILVEQMDYIQSITVERVKKVIEKNAGGNTDNILDFTVERVKKVIEKNAGGEFVYCELANDAEKFRNEVRNANTTDLPALLEKIKNSSFLSYRVDREHLNDFENLTENEQRTLLLQLVDTNTLYVNYTDIESTDYEINETDKKLNKQFYRK